MKKILKNISVFLAVFMFVIFPLFVFAAVETPPSTSQPIGIHVTNPFNCGGQPNCTLTTFVVTVLNNIVMPIAAVVATLFIIWAGFSYVKAQGNPKQIEEAHQRLLWALIGTAILLGAAGISQVVQKTVDSLIIK